MDWFNCRSNRCRNPLIIGIYLVLASLSLHGQASPVHDPVEQATYERILKQVRSIPIFDNHSHPGFADDDDVDAMASPPEHEPLRLRLDNPELIAASKDLFDYPYADNSAEHLKWLVKKKAELKGRYPGYQYFDRILDKLNVETMVANRVSLGSYLDPKRFRWVFFVDSFLFPFDNTELAQRNVDEGVYVPLQEKQLKKEMQQAGLTALPATFADYLAFITKVVEQNRAHGGVGIKFEIAYFRTLHFDDPPEEAAETIYRKYHAGGSPTAAEHTVFEDYVFRFLLSEAGRLNLAVQIHTAVGIGDYFSVTNGNILNLENILRDARYSNVTFVLLHGGYPFQGQAIWLAARQNVYLDSSLMELYLYPADLKTVLRHWLLLYPDKVVFGSDAFPFNEAVGAEESDWLGVETARTALAAALTEMILNHEVTEARALEMAHAYLHDNASRIYAAPLGQ
jgi:hypothetical protein